MTAYVVIVRERTTDPDELERYRDKAPLAREGRPRTRRPPMRNAVPSAIIKESAS